jgi:hypothetical protein
MTRRGRPPEPGVVYYLGRLRFRPGEDPPALKEFLDTFMTAPPRSKQSILKAALIGGLEQAREAQWEAFGEDEETTAGLEVMFAEF